MTDPVVPRAARLLGYAGLIPFILISVGLWILPLVYAGFLHAALIGYGLVIVSFMGGVQWGLGIAKPLDDGTTWRVLSQSVAPPLIAWFGAMGPFPWQYPALILAFLLVIWVDFKLVRQDAAPTWYPLLRVPLTAGVVVCLVGGWAHALLMR
ncbi:MAG: DUF3429 domain-containing protein [Geminicoccaceae bacterium]|nr:MAG: DUF3429 domain-containing protein [Geminicoccaceae bacterium]